MNGTVCSFSYSAILTKITSNILILAEYSMFFVKIGVVSHEAYSHR